MARHTKRREREKRPSCWKLDHSSSLDQPDEQHSQGDDQQDVNVAIERIRRHHPQQPKNQQNNENCPQHEISPRIGSPYDFCRAEYFVRTDSSLPADGGGATSPFTMSRFSIRLWYNASLSSMSCRR